MATIGAQLILSLLRVYRYFFSPWLGWNCRFYPSCSYYAMAAIKNDGLVKGSYLSLRRLLRCHPWHSGGIDDSIAPPGIAPVTSQGEKICTFIKK